MNKRLLCCKRMCSLLIVFLLLVGCGNRTLTQSTAPTEAEMPKRDAYVNVEWRDFTLTNAEGQRLVMDHDKGDYPDGDMGHGEFGSVAQSPALLFFDVPHSERFEFKRGGGEFWCSISAATYGGSVNAEDMETAVFSEKEVSMEGGAGMRWITMDLKDMDCNLRLEEQTEGKTVMTRDGSTVTITGVAGNYRLLIAKGTESYQDPIEGTAETGTLVIDLSRVMEENILTVTDGATTIEHEVKKS